jgi:hypothetical protein
MSRFVTVLEDVEITRAKDVAKHGDGDQSAHGNRYGVEVAPEIVRSTLERVKANGGLSVNLKDGSEPTKGFMVAKGKKYAAIVKAEDFFDETKGAEILSSYMKRNKADLATGKNYLGLWHNQDDGQVYLDVSENIMDENEAISRGRDRDQISIWDVANFKEIQTGGTGGIEKTRGSRTARFVTNDRRTDRRLRQRNLGEVSKTFKVIYFDFGLKPVLKHGEHDQSEHGNWATGRTDEQIARIESMKDVGPSGDEIRNALTPSPVEDYEIRLLVENNPALYELLQEKVQEKMTDREYEISQMSENEKIRVEEQLMELITNDYIEDNRDDLESQIRDERGDERLGAEELTMRLAEVFDIEHTGVDQDGNERTFSSRVGYGDDTGSGIQIMGDIIDENGDTIGEFTRTFFEKNGALLVEHDLLNIWADENRGTGFGKEFIQRSEAWYVAQGLDGIVVSTGLEDGARHWARAGYDWRSPDHAESALSTLIASAGNRFERNSPERAEFDSIMARAFDGYKATPEGDLSMKVEYKSVKSMKEDGFPLPAEFANIGYKDGDKDWAGKNLMYGQNFKYSKALTAEGMRLLEGPIDHDGDGMIYDGTPREKPAPSKKN